MILTDPTTRRALQGLSREYARAQTEQDKAFMSGNHEAEGRARGRCEGLVVAVRVIAGLDDEASAVALLDTLDS